MKLYIDEVTAKDLFQIVIRLPLLLVDLVKEELFWWFKLYPFEIMSPVDWQKDCRTTLKESFKRKRRHKIESNYSK